MELTKYLDGSRWDSLAVGIPGVAGVDAAILRVHRQQVQGNVVKIISGTEPVTWTKC
jgi:hypothetical protein